MPRKARPPQSARNNAKKALRWREEHGRSVVKGGTLVGWRRANQLASGQMLTEETIRRMANFERHRKNAAVDPKYRGEPWRDRGHVAWLLWGGSSGVGWAKRQVDKWNREDKRKAR